jgi:LPXTG-site transpeptidase (sortase) family protein
MASNHEVGSSSLSGCTIALSKFVVGGMQHSQKRIKLLASLFVVIGLAGLTGALFGHVSSWKANGVFYNLKKLQTGKRIIITRGDSQVFTYQVISSKTYPYNNVDMKAVLSPVDPSRPGLNLMTCTGNIIKGTNEFNERVVVFTSLVKS